jgi:predicted  nucleic acid-binding Zn-ribbon protein
MTAPLTLDATGRGILAELAGVDERTRLLTARLQALPETAEVERLEAADEERQRLARRARGDERGRSATLWRLTRDAANMRARRRRDIEGLRANPDTERRRDLRHDLAVAERRLAELTDEIAREQRTLEAFGAPDDPGHAGPVEDPALVQARAEQQAVVRDLTGQITDLEHRSRELREALPPQILALYRDGERDHGVGAAPLLGSSCGACFIDLDAVTLRRFAAAPADEVLTCPECGVLLLRDTAR